MTHYELNLRDYIRIIRKRKFIIIASFVIFTLASFFYISSQVPIYEASTTIKIEERKTVAGLLTEWIIYSPGDTMATQAKVIKGFPVMRRAALNMGLIDGTTPLPEVYKIVRRIQSKIDTNIIERTNIIKITCQDNKPKDAMDLANTVAASYIEKNLLEKNKQARTTRKFIEEQLASLENRLEATEDELNAFGEEVENIKIAGDVQKKLIDLEFELISLVQKYTEKHPKVAQLKEQVKRMEQQLGGFSGRELEYARIQREVEVNRKIYAMLRQKLEEVRITEAEKIPDASVVDPATLPTSAANVQSKLNMLFGGFLGLVIGVALSFVTESLDTSMGTIEDVENVAKLPVLGVVPSVIHDKDRPVGYLERLRRRFFPVKDTEYEERYVRLVSHYRPTHPIAESFRNIKTNIKFSPSRKTILVTSAGPQEGKTTILINLGLVCAQEGLKTLLISSDLRRPALAESFGFDKRPGLSDVVMGTVSLREVLRGTADIILGEINIEEVLIHPALDHICILPCGPSPLNPIEVLDSKKFDDVLQEMHKEFDIILLDSPPTLPVTDSSILAPKTDGVVLCYEIGRTSRHALVRAKTQIESSGGNIVGVILNHTQAETEAIDVYPYYYKYKYRYYGKKKEPKTEQKV